ncbi:NAD-binding protein [Nesterenkonia sp. K-15-9-6]|uniref:NAD-binding protein n=1 Tax=Nesterenkonia sp. K-15-9-6 TaxID=3093918 RepID=UPI0040445F9B
MGFFLTIGMGTTPTWADLGLAAALCVVLLPLKTVGFMLLGRAFGQRNRTAAMSGLVLGNFSEFALIVSVVGVSVGLLEEQELVVIAVAVALSMILSSLLNGRGHEAVDRVASWLPGEDPDRLRPSDRPIETGEAQVLVLGMGRVGRAAYDGVQGRGFRVVGIDNDHVTVERLRSQGYDLVEGDATDHSFWDRVSHSGIVELVILAMPVHDSNSFALSQLEKSSFDGQVAAVVQHDEQAHALEARGVQAVFNLYEGAGVALADAACSDLR